jgi:fimbrial chaperone protein
MHPALRLPGRSSFRRPALPSALAAAVAAIAVCLLASPPALAQALTVHPVTVELTGDQHAAVLTVQNSGEKPTVVQTRAFAWTQAGGKDVLIPAADVAISPPFATIPPGQSQTVRLVLRTPKVSRETSYRVFIDQVPTPGPDGISLAIRLSIPVFIEPDPRARPKLAWKVLIGPDGQAELNAVNSGPRRVRLSDVTVTASGMPSILAERGAMAYVLPGSERTWKLGAPGALAGAVQARVAAATDQGSLNADAIVASKP